MTLYDEAMRELKKAREAQYAAREVMSMLKAEWKHADTEESFEIYLKAHEAYRKATDNADRAEAQRNRAGSAYTTIRKA